MAGLTTHILDLAHGKPAANVKVELFSFEGVTKRFVKTSVTNSDGRLDSPLLTKEEIADGQYELLFHIGEYFRGKEVLMKDPHFLEEVPVRFGISETDSHYHVPLLVSPWGYQVYRGS
ncbi:hydroxyisourate hydrolase [Aquibacillus albus]|uniref:5-hydroxyisourate hydrolase n=1 Tax=Aquibacillus albus TaxID=1168171 RepID=A0ABS2MZ78_9BACI|nr:hydroxyisourate hydrolase [Aquibacillus albus]MBM7571118.1 5-hydroxyisourate hydrolase [Aquibacillus albus]